MTDAWRRGGKLPVLQNAPATNSPPPAKLPHPAVTVTARASSRLRAGHVWVYRSDLAAEPAIAPGSVATVLDERGRPLGTALYSSASQIALRLLTSAVETIDLPGLIRRRLEQSVALRESLVTNTDAYRVVFTEGDFLPGLIVDRYHDLLSLQALTQAMDQEAVRAAVVATLVEKFAPTGIVERVEPRIRELEQLPPRQPRLLHGSQTETVFTLNGVRFQYDAMSGQKTGAFLDQRENYAAAEQYARGQALDVFCYQGGFALHLARKCSQVTAVDSSRPALEVADQNAALNGHEIEWIEANAFDLLKDYAAAGRQYDIIVLDPPAFAKSKRALDTALRGYKELNLRALKMLRRGGTLVTCSCSFHLSEAAFLDMLAAASLDAHRVLRVLERRGQAKDHPVLLTVPETAYLKCVIAQVAL